MRIGKVYISGFRSISQSAEITLSEPDKGSPKVIAVDWSDSCFSFELRRDREGRHLTGLVGQNNAGKSNILRALLLFFSNLDSSEKSVRIAQNLDYHCCSPEEDSTSPDARICIEILFRLDQEEEIESLEDYRVNAELEQEATTLLCLGAVWKFDGSCHWYIRQNLASSGVQEIGSDLRSSALRRIAGSLPRFYWLPTGIDISKEQQIRGSKYLKSLVDDVVEEIKELQSIDEESVEEELSKDERRLRQQLQMTQASLQGLRDELEQLKDLPSPLNELASLLVSNMEPIMPGVEAWFEYTSALPTDYWKWLDVSMIRLDDGWPTSISEKGHGAQRTFAVALLQAYAAYKARKIGEHPYILAIEEPEIYMHPHVARALSATLESLSCDGQVLFSTHSPTFVQPLDWENLVLVTKRGASSVLTQISRSALDDEQREKIRRNVEAKECEMFFARRVLLVEGKTERFAIPGFIKTLKNDKSHPIRYDLDEMGVSILAVGGSGNFGPFLTLLKSFGIPLCILVDADAIGTTVSQMRQAGLLTRDEIDELNGYGDDFDAKQNWLVKHNCFVLKGDFETVVARSLRDDERLWELINIGRRQRGIDQDLPEVSFPGQEEAQIGDMVEDWKRSLWSGVKSSVVRSQREDYKDEVISAPEETQEWLEGLAARLIQHDNWEANSREKWFASKMVRKVGKALMGQVLGNELSSEEIQSLAGIEALLDHLAQHARSSC